MDTNDLIECGLIDDAMADIIGMAKHASDVRDGLILTYVLGTMRARLNFLTRDLDLLPHPFRMAPGSATQFGRSVLEDHVAAD